MLTLNCNHFNQVMAQHCVAKQYNEDVKSVFAVALRAHSKPLDRAPIRVALLYAYDTGIQPDAVDRFSDVYSREIGLAAQSVDDSGKLVRLLVDSEYTERKATSHRRALKWKTLDDPRDNDIHQAYKIWQSANTKDYSSDIWLSDDSCSSFTSDTDTKEL